MLSLKKKEVPFHVGQKVCESVGAVYEDSEDSDKFEIHGRFARFKGEKYGRICLKKRTKIGERSKTILKFQNNYGRESKVTVTRGDGSSRWDKQFFVVERSKMTIKINAKNGELPKQSLNWRGGTLCLVGMKALCGDENGTDELKTCIELHGHGSLVEVIDQLAMN